MPDVGTIRMVNHGAYLEGWDGEAWVPLVFRQHDEHFEDPLARLDQWLQADRAPVEPDSVKRRFLQERLGCDRGHAMRM